MQKKKWMDGERKGHEWEVKEVRTEIEERKVRGTGAESGRKQGESTREADGE